MVIRPWDLLYPNCHIFTMNVRGLSPAEQESWEHEEKTEQTRTPAG